MHLIVFCLFILLRKTLDLFLADGDFEPTMEEEDDEETIEVEEQQEGNDAESHQREIELLKEESLLPLDQLLSTLNLPQVQTWTDIFLLFNKWKISEFFCKLLRDFWTWQGQWPLGIKSELCFNSTSLLMKWILSHVWNYRLQLKRPQSIFAQGLQDNTNIAVVMMSCSKRETENMCFQFRLFLMLKSLSTTGLHHYILYFGELSIWIVEFLEKIKWCWCWPLMNWILQESVSEEECSDESSSTVGNEEEDGEFTANEEDGKITLTT